MYTYTHLPLRSLLLPPRQPPTFLWGWDHPLEHFGPSRGHVFKTTDSPSCRSHQQSIAPRFGVKVHKHRPLPHWNMDWLDGVQVLCRQPLQWVHEFSSPVCRSCCSCPWLGLVAKGIIEKPHVWLSAPLDYSLHFGETWGLLSIGREKLLTCTVRLHHFVRATQANICATAGRVKLAVTAWLQGLP